MKTLIIVLGHAGSGKTTTTNYLTDILSNAETIKFAKPLYNNIFPFSSCWVDITFKTNPPKANICASIMYFIVFTIIILSYLILLDYMNKVYFTIFMFFFSYKCGNLWLRSMIYEK